MKISTVIIISCIIGICIGFGSVFIGNQVWHWNPDLETNPDAVEQQAQAAVKMDPNAKIEVKNSIYDFGTMRHLDTGKHSFEVKNVGTAVLTLKPNMTTCQCTKVEVSKRRVSPGETALVTLHWDSDRAMALFRQQATVETNDPDNPEVVFTIQGLFIFPIITKPTSVVFPVIYANSKAETEGYCTIYGFEEEPKLQFTSIDWTDKEHFDIELTPVELDEADKEDTLNKNASYKYLSKITVKPGLPMGPFREKFVLKTNYLVKPTVEIFVSGQVSSDRIVFNGKGYDRTKGILDLGTVSINQGTSQQLNLVLSGLGAANTEIEIKEVHPPCLKVVINDEAKPAEGETRRIRTLTMNLSIPPGSPSGDYSNLEAGTNGYIVFTTTNPDITTIRLPVTFNIPSR